MRLRGRVDALYKSMFTLLLTLLCCSPNYKPSKNINLLCLETCLAFVNISRTTKNEYMSKSDFVEGGGPFLGLNIRFKGYIYRQHPGGCRARDLGWQGERKYAWSQFDTRHRLTDRPHVVSSHRTLLAAKRNGMPSAHCPVNFCMRRTAI